MNFIIRLISIIHMRDIDVKNAKLFGERIKELRDKENSSLNSFVLSRSSMTTATWSRVENAKTDVKLSTILKIASTFNITVAELLQNIDFDYNFNED